MYCVFYNGLYFIGVFLVFVDYIFYDKVWKYVCLFCVVVFDKGFDIVGVDIFLISGSVEDMIKSEFVFCVYNYLFFIFWVWNIFGVVFY